MKIIQILSPLLAKPKNFQMKNQLFLLCLLFAVQSMAQTRKVIPAIHSHNDYLHETPLFGALKAGARSIEIDVFLVDEFLIVAHTKKEIFTENTLESLYIQPLKKFLASTKEKPEFHFMIDIKSEAYSTLKEIDATLKKYPELFSPNGIQVIISGNRPKSEDYKNYSPFIWFDGRHPADIQQTGGERIAMISQNLSKFTKWRGEGKISSDEKNQLVDFIKKCHKYNKPVRFWNAGESKEMLDFLYSINVDYISTDSPFTVKNFIDNKLSK